MVRHLPAHDLTMEDIKDERRVHPPSLRRNIRNIGDPNAVRTRCCELAFDEIVRTLLSPSRSRLRTLPLPPDAVDAQLAHQPLHRAASNMPELVGVFAVDRLPHLPHPVTGIVRLIDILDHHHQRPVPTGPGRGLTLLVCVIRAHSNPCSSHRQGSHDWLDSELVAIVVDEGDDHFDGRSSSAAKKADALFRISLALFASANSARDRRVSASISTDSAGVALPESLCLRPQTRMVSLLNPSSFATRVIAPFAVSGSVWAWMTSSTARALSSSVYFTGKRESPSSNLPASIIPGAIHPDEVAAAGGDGDLPFGVIHRPRPIPLIEGVQARVQAVAEDDRPAADGAGDLRVLSFRIAGHVDPPPERQRPRIQRFRQRGFPTADDPGEDHVRGGD